MKQVNFQCVYEVPDEYPYVAFNMNGSLVGFIHAPIRDTKISEWIDSVDGSFGTIIPYDRWETSVRETVRLTDTQHNNPGMKKEKLPFKEKIERRKRA